MWECYDAYWTGKLHLRVEKRCKQDGKLAEGCLEEPKTRDYFLKQHLGRRNNTAKQCADAVTFSRRDNLGGRGLASKATESQGVNFYRE